MRNFSHQPVLTKGIDSNASCKVQVLLAMGVIEACALTVRENHVWPRIGLYNIPEARVTLS